MAFTTPLRYPGGKARLTAYMQKVLHANNLIGGTYIEPYAGGAGMAINLLLNKDVDEIIINDADPAIYCFWKSVTEQADKLVKKIEDSEISIEEWKKQKKIQESINQHSTLEIGFSTFYLNRTNRSGILKGGVIGGISQNGKYRMDARFNKTELINRIEAISEKKDSIRVSCRDGIELLKNPMWDVAQSMAYIDPPYFMKGSLLYMNHYKPDDHERLSVEIKKLKSNWILSYDDVPEVRRMYNWATPIEFKLHYSTAKSCFGKELFFASDSLIMPKTKVESFRGGCIPE